MKPLPSKSTQTLPKSIHMISFCPTITIRLLQKNISKTLSSIANFEKYQITPMHQK